MNLHSQRWDNPRPDTPIESIVIRSRQAKEVPLVLAITLGSQVPNLVNGDVGKVTPFSVRMKNFMKNFDAQAKTRDLPQGWSTNASYNTRVANVFSGASSGR